MCRPPDPRLTRPQVADRPCERGHKHKRAPPATRGATRGLSFNAFRPHPDPDPHAHASALQVPRPAVPVARRHPPNRQDRGRTRVARSRGDLAAGAHRPAGFRPAPHQEGGTAGGRAAPRPLQAPQGGREQGSLRCAWVPGPFPGPPPPPGAAPAARRQPVPPGGPAPAGEPARSGREGGAPRPRHQPLPRRPLPDRRPHPGRRLLPGPPDRDHVHPRGDPPRGAGAGPAVPLPLQDRAERGRLDRGRDDLGLRVPRRGRGGLQPPRTRPRGRPTRQARSLQRMAGGRGPDASGVRVQEAAGQRGSGRTPASHGQGR